MFPERERLWFQAMLVSLMVAAGAERSTHDVVYAAIIAALAAIVGGIIGGTIPGYFMLKAEDKRQTLAREMANQARRDELERESRAVIGAARALYEYFDRVGMMCGVSLENQRWWSDKVDATLQPPSLDDQKAVLGQLSSYEAGVVTTTMRLIELLRATRERDPVSERLDDVTMAQLESGRTAMETGTGSLQRVAQLPEIADADRVIGNET